VYSLNFITKRSAFSSVFSADSEQNQAPAGYPIPEIAVGTNSGKAGHEIVPGVQIWYVVHGSNSHSSLAELSLTRADIDEFAPVRHAGARQRSYETRDLLRRALSDAVGGEISPEDWRFDRTEFGQPTLSNGRNNLKFSCSHTPEMSVVAVSTIGDVGIDIADAEFEAGSEWLGDVMAPRELAGLVKLPDADRPRAVARLWTLKEAFVKMLGTGIAEVADKAFDLNHDRLLPGSSSDGPEQPEFRTWIANHQGQRYSVALASSSSVAAHARLSHLSEGSVVYSRDQFPFLGR